MFLASLYEVLIIQDRAGDSLMTSLHYNTFSISTFRRLKTNNSRVTVRTDSTLLSHGVTRILTIRVFFCQLFP